MATVLREGFARNSVGVVLAGDTDIAFTVDADENLRCIPDPGCEFTVGIYVGETEEEIALPAIVVICQSAREDMDARGNYSCDIEVQVQFNADSSEQNPKVTDALKFIGDGVRSILGHSTLPSLMSDGADDFGCMGVEAKSTSREVDGRTRIQKHVVTVYVCGSTIQ